jgi:hypothetical protein
MMSLVMVEQRPGLIGNPDWVHRALGSGYSRVAGASRHRPARIDIETVDMGVRGPEAGIARPLESPQPTRLQLVRSPDARQILA